jgi:hypothetical protein
MNIFLRKLLGIFIIVLMSNIAFCEDSTPPVLTVLSPNIDSIIYTKRPVISCGLKDLESGIDRNKTVITLDGKDYTFYAKRTSTMIVFIPIKDLEEGVHKVEIEASDRQGNINSISWLFNVRIPKVERLKIGGNISLFTEYAQVKERPINESILAYKEGFNGEFRLNSFGEKRGINVMSQVFVTGKESKDRQPYNRYRFDIEGLSYNLTIGDFYPFFSRLSLFRERLRGCSLQIRRNIWGIGLRLFPVYGQTKRAIEGKSGVPGTYLRKLYGVKGECSFFGGKTTLGINYLKSEDDQDSIKNPGTKLPLKNEVRSLLLEIRPLRWALISGEVAHSKDNIDPEKGKALRFNVATKLEKFMFEAIYRDIDDRYISLGNTNIQNDIRGYELKIECGPFKDAFKIRGSFSSMRDNTQNKKLATTETQVASGNLSWRLGKMTSLILGYNIRERKSNEKIPIIYNQTELINAGIETKTLKTNVNFSVNLTRYREKADVPLSSSYDNTSIMLCTRTKTPKFFSLSNGFGMNLTKNIDLKKTIKYYVIDMRPELIIGKLIVNLGFNGVYGMLDSSKVSNKKQSLLLELTYKVREKMLFTFSLEDLKYIDKKEIQKSYHENIARIRSSYSF